MSTCKNCRFFNGGFETCCRMPPVARDYGLGVWPQVNIEDWCGEFQAVEEASLPTQKIGEPHKVEILSGDALYKMDTQSGNVEIMKEKEPIPAKRKRSTKKSATTSAKKKATRSKK